VFIFALLGAACVPLPTPEAAPTPTLTSPTPAPSQTPLPTATPIPPSPTATFTPIEGRVIAQINVRSGPNVSYSSLGILESGQTIQILGRDQSGDWYVIAYPSGPQGRGWVTAAYVQAGDTAGLPVVEIQDSDPAVTGKATQQLNVRSGPGTDYNVLGMIQPDTVMLLTGKNESATWLQIEYAGGPGGQGWVNTAYVQANDTASLPLLNASGTPVTPGTAEATSIPVTPTPTIAPASADGDSSAAPAARVTFSPSGLRQFSYSSDLSSPQGDAEDWVEFTPYASLAGSPARILLSLACNGNGKLTVELWRNGAPLKDWSGLVCGDRDELLDLDAGQAYQFRLRADSGVGLRYVHYTLTVRNAP
ncbi:MAG: SH3 domain-containing protein, partial [Burkholderiaceae bacterium]|nr:SH3 domain-containing protein [Burkholderiaceae bacterium]